MPTNHTFVANATKELSRAKSPLSRALFIAWVKSHNLRPSDFKIFGSDHYGSSVNFEYDLRLDHPDLIVPERETVLAMGAQPGWSPANEAAPTKNESCPHCRETIGPPKTTVSGEPPGDPTRFVCPRCHRSGFDSQLARQRALAGEPMVFFLRKACESTDSSSRKTPKSNATRLTRKERRKQIFSSAACVDAIIAKRSIMDDLNNSTNDA